MDEQVKKEIYSLVEKAKNVFVSSVDENGFPNTKAMFSLERDGMGVHYFQLMCPLEEWLNLKPILTRAFIIVMNQLSAA